MEAVQDAISNAGVFYVALNFGLWADFCGGSVSDFISQYSRLYGAFLLSQRKSCEIQYVEKNKANRLARAQQMLLLPALKLRVLVRTRREVSGLRQGQQQAAIKRLQVVWWCRKARRSRQKMMILMFVIE